MEGYLRIEKSIDFFQVNLRNIVRGAQALFPPSRATLKQYHDQVCNSGTSPAQNGMMFGFLSLRNNLSYVFTRSPFLFQVTNWGLRYEASATSF